MNLKDILLIILAGAVIIFTVHAIDTRHTLTGCIGIPLTDTPSPDVLPKRY
jgi:hypothetical protein